MSLRAGCSKPWYGSEPVADDRLEAVLTLLRSRGGRVTVPRRAVLAALLASDGHVTAEELTRVVHRRHPDIHESTVYRTLDMLAELDVVDHVHLGHGAAVYHLADDRHQHLLCRACGAVVEVPDDLFAALRRHLERHYGFELSLRHFALGGTCRRCRADPGRDASGRRP
jgi:Fur family ferric uptake transcriptional regulator